MSGERHIATRTDLSDRPAEPKIDASWAWTPYTPDTDRPWNLVRAGHLFRRAAFGATWNQLQQALADGPQRTIDRLLQPPSDVAAFQQTFDDYDLAAARSNSPDALRAWWLRRMIETPHPLLEKMTLFWHNHFAVSYTTVKDPRLMLAHIRSLRDQALGRWDSLFKAIVRDPATLIGLGAEENRKSRPNEPFARQLLERFTVGAGHFTESDVRDVARSFTGWFVMQNRLRVFTREQDSGSKSVFGQSGNYDGDDIAQILLDQPDAHRRLVRQLYRWLISEEEPPEDSLVQPLTDAFARDYDLSRLVGTILRSNLFFSPVAYRHRVKSPVEFALEIVHGLEGLVPTDRLGRDLATLGQDLLRPPISDGWSGGRQWINPAILVQRSNLALALVMGSGSYGAQLDPWRVANDHGFSDAASAGRFLINLFLQDDLDDRIVRLMWDASVSALATKRISAPQQVRQIAQFLLALPEFQLS